MNLDEDYSRSVTATPRAYRSKHSPSKRDTQYGYDRKDPEHSGSSHPLSPAATMVYDLDASSLAEYQNNPDDDYNAILPFPEPSPYLNPMPPSQTSSNRFIIPQLQYEHIQLPQRFPFGDRFVYLAQRVYRARCLDLVVSPSREQEIRFVSLMSHACAPADKPANSYFSVQNLQLGISAAREICEFLYFDEQFETLHLGGNPIGDVGAGYLGETLKRNRTLHHLKFMATSLEPQGFQAIFLGMAQCPQLLSFDGGSVQADGRMSIGEVGTRALGRMLEKHPNLYRLRLNKVGLSNKAFGIFARGLAASPSLGVIDITGNILHPRHVAMLAKALPQISCLEELILVDTGLTNSSILLLEPALRQCAELKVLDLKRNRIRLSGLTLLSDCVSTMYGLQSLVLDDNLLGSSPLLGWDEMFREDLNRQKDTAKRLKECHLANTIVSSRMLNSSSSLRSLSIKRCQLGDASIEDLCDALNDGQIQTLDLANNNLSNQGAIAVSKLVGSSPSLTTLNLSSNRVGDEGGLALGSAILQNPTLTHLLITNNQLKERAAYRLVHVLNNTRFLRCQADGNAIPYTAFAKLQELSNRNHISYESNTIERLQTEIARLMVKQRKMEQIKSDCIQFEQEIKDLNEILRRDELALEALRASEHKKEQALSKELARKGEERCNLDLAMGDLHHEESNGKARYFQEANMLVGQKEQMIRAQEHCRNHIESLKAKAGSDSLAQGSELRKKTEELAKERQECDIIASMCLSQLRNVKSTISQFKKAQKQVMSKSLVTGAGLGRTRGTTRPSRPGGNARSATSGISRSKPKSNKPKTKTNKPASRKKTKTVNKKDKQTSIEDISTRTTSGLRPLPKAGRQLKGAPQQSMLLRPVPSTLQEPPTSDRVDFVQVQPTSFPLYSTEANPLS